MHLPSGLLGKELSWLASLGNSKQLATQIMFESPFDVIAELPQAENNGSERWTAMQVQNNRETASINLLHTHIIPTSLHELVH